MADPDQRQEEVKMQDLNLERDDDYDNYRPPRPGGNMETTDFGGTPQDPGVDEIFSTGPAPSAEDTYEIKRNRLKAIFENIIGEPIITSHLDEKLFKRCTIDEPNRNGHTRLRYDGREIYHRNGWNADWVEYRSVTFNPILSELRTGQERYKTSATKQVDDAAGVRLPEDVSESIRMSVLRDLSDARDDDGGTKVTTTSMDSGYPTSTTFSEFSDVGTQVGTETRGVGTQVGTETRGVGTQVGTVDIEKLQAEIISKETVIKSQEKRLREISNEFNELRLRKSNDDVISEKEREINEVQEKLKKVEMEQDELLGEVRATDSDLREQAEKVRELTEQNKNMRQEYEAIQKAAIAQKDAEISAITQKYWHDVNKLEKTKADAAKEYYDASKEISLEYKKTMDKADKKLKAFEDKFKSMNKKIKILKDVHVKQTHAAKEYDVRNREIGGLARVMETFDTINRRIDNPNPDELDLMPEYLDGVLPGLREQAKEYREKTEKNKGNYAKKHYDSLARLIEREIDIVNLRLDRKAEYEEAKLRLKEETNNDPRTKFEKFKKWTKDNGLELGSVVISIGSLIAVIATALRKTIQTVAKGAFSFGKAVVKVLSKLGPVFSALGNIILTLLGFVSKALMWLGNNLWVLLVF